MTIQHASRRLAIVTGASRRRGIGAPLVHLPYFLPDDWSGGIEDEEPEISPRPYLAAAGRHDVVACARKPQ